MLIHPLSPLDVDLETLTGSVSNLSTVDILMWNKAVPGVLDDTSAMPFGQSRPVMTRNYSRTVSIPDDATVSSMDHSTYPIQDSLDDRITGGIPESHPPNPESPRFAYSSERHFAEANEASMQRTHASGEAYSIDNTGQQVYMNPLDQNTLGSQSVYPSDNSVLFAVQRGDAMHVSHSHKAYSSFHSNPVQTPVSWSQSDIATATPSYGPWPSRIGANPGEFAGPVLGNSTTSEPTGWNAASSTDRQGPSLRLRRPAMYSNGATMTLKTQIPDDGDETNSLGLEYGETGLNAHYYHAPAGQTQLPYGASPTFAYPDYTDDDVGTPATLGTTSSSGEMPNMTQASYPASTTTGTLGANDVKTSSTSSSISGSSKRSHGKTKTTSARQGPLYDASPKEDGLYHCPYEANEDCTHKPVKLKCQHDKYVDSHERAYTCNQPGCEEQRFSSAACKLRHEREAHGSHGHGLKPFLCTYHDCERAQPDSGFPRLWNRNDHMKRKHNHVWAHSEETTSPTPSPAAKVSQGRLPRDRPVLEHKKKRPAADKARVVADKKRKGQSITKGNASSNSAAEIERLQTGLATHWKEHHAIVTQTLSNLREPRDLQAVQHLHREVSELANISHRLGQLEVRLRETRKEAP